MSQKLHAFQGSLLGARIAAVALTFLSISQAERKERIKAKASDSQLELVPLKMPGVRLVSSSPLLVTAGFRGKPKQIVVKAKHDSLALLLCVHSGAQVGRRQGTVHS